MELLGYLGITTLFPGNYQLIAGITTLLDRITTLFPELGGYFLQLPPNGHRCISRGGEAPPAQASRGTPPLNRGWCSWMTQKSQFSSIFDRFYSVFIFYPPRNWISGGAVPPRICSFLGVYRCFYILPPPKLVSTESTCRPKAGFTKGFHTFFIFYPPPKLDPS